MNLTNLEVLEAASALDEIAQQECSVQDWEAAMRMRQLLRRMRALFDMRDEVTAARLALARKYGKYNDGKLEIDERGGITIDPVQDDVYRAEMRKKLAETADVDVQPITREELQGIGISRIPGRLFALLGSLLEETSPGKP